MIYNSTLRRKGFMYEYVTKKEYRPIREELEKIIKRTQIYICVRNLTQHFNFNLSVVEVDI